MIAAHQPTIFGGRIITALSSRADGSMRLRDREDGSQPGNYETFLKTLGILPSATTYQQISYDGDDFCRYRILTAADQAKGMEVPVFADGLAVDRPRHAVFLTLADCTGTILYDPVHESLMVSHLGRHSTEQHGAAGSVAFMREHFHSEPSDILVWCGPSPGKSAYPLYRRHNLSLHEANREDLLAAGILPEHLELSTVDTAGNPDYFSHTDYVNGRSPDDGRFAIVAMLV